MGYDDVTPEMMAAGVEILIEFQDSEDYDARNLVRQIFLAMKNRQASPEGNCPDGSKVPRSPNAR